MERDEFYSALYLAHHGIKGQHWGIRRYQNEDGSLTPAGEKRAQNTPNKSHDRAKTALKVGATVAVAALAAYGGYKLAKYRKGKSLGNAMTNNLRRADAALKEYGNTPLKSIHISNEMSKPAGNSISLTLNPGTNPGANYNAQIMESLNQMRRMGRNQNRR